jgi:DNA helicase MCM8
MNAGKMPKTIDCEIRDDLIDSCISGDIVTVCGVMKTELQNDMKGFGANKNRALHSSYIDVNSVRSSNSEFFLSTALGRGEDNSTVNLADQKMNLAELNLIHKISERKDLFPLLVKSICPSIFGNEIVKCGQLFSLFGGTDHRLRAKAGEFTEFLSKDDKNGQVAQI